MKYVARVARVLQSGIHKMGAVRDGKVVPVADMPSPTRVEIELEGEPSQACMMFRYTDAGDDCGDTWHENLESAFAQAEFEYGLTRGDFTRVE